jgi:hypothetical protein
MNNDEDSSNRFSNQIDTVQDALLFCDYLGKFGNYDFKNHFQSIAAVIRQLARRLEEQAVTMERLEAKRGA